MLRIHLLPLGLVVYFQVLFECREAAENCIMTDESSSTHGRDESYIQYFSRET
jgi:hypothetical protein